MTTHRWHSLALALAYLVLTSCRDSSEPTAPPEAGSALATTTTAALAFAQVSAGDIHTCGVTTDNRAYCWGWNIFGQLGDGTETQRLRPVAVVGGHRFRQISAGSYNTCGVTVDSRAYCWGNHQVRPMEVVGGHRFRQVSAGEDHTCGVTTEDRAYCWGTNVFGQLGNGTHDPDGNNHPTPVAVAGGLRFREVRVGPYHSCGVTTNDRAYCWGRDRFGEIGDGSAHGNCMFSGRALPCRKSPALVAGEYRFRQVDAGGGLGPGEGSVGTDGGRTCGVTTNGRAFCWGDGSHGQNGNGTRSIIFSPRLVSGGLQFSSVSAGLNRTCGVTTENRAYCWGDGRAGGVGDGTTSQRLTPAAVAGDLHFRLVSAGGLHTCGTTPGSVAYCWGYNAQGQLGDGTTSRRLRPRAVAGAM